MSRLLNDEEAPNASLAGRLLCESLMVLVSGMAGGAAGAGLLQLWKLAQEGCHVSQACR